MKFTQAITYDIDTAAWAADYDVPDGAEDITEVLTRTAAEGAIAEAITKQWPMMRDAATVTVSAPGTALDTLIDNGLTFAECVKAFAARQQDPGDVVSAARDQYQDEGSVEIDDNAIISDSGEGAYVMAWVWVDADEDEDDDGCASYDKGYQVLTRDGRTVGVEDLREGDEYRDPATDGDDEWYPVTRVHLAPDGVTVDVYQVAGDQPVHVEGDGCASYDTGYQVVTRDGATVDVEQLEQGDEYQDPAMDGAGEWYPVVDVQVMPGGMTVHVQSADDPDKE